MPGHIEDLDSEAAAIREALASLLNRRDYEQIALEEVLAKAGIDRESFERCFADLDACLLAVWKETEHAYIAETLAAFSAEEKWLDGMRACAWATCRFMQADHRRARILMFKLEVGGEAVRAERDQLIALYVEVVHAGRFETDDPDAVPRDLAAGIANAAWERINDRVRGEEFERMPEDVPDLLYLTALPYLGTAAAERELERARGEQKHYELP